MSTDISMDENLKRKLDPASQRLRETHEREMETLGYINGIHRDWGDDSLDVERKRGSYRMPDWMYDMYYRR